MRCVIEKASEYPGAAQRVAQCDRLAPGMGRQTGAVVGRRAQDDRHVGIRLGIFQQGLNFAKPNTRGLGLLQIFTEDARVSRGERKMDTGVTCSLF